MVKTTSKRTKIHLAVNSGRVGFVGGVVVAKRFTDTEKWNDPWYRKLPVAYKNFWDYLCARCDNAGVWKVDMEMAQFQVDRTVDSEEAIKLFGERVEPLNENYWHIKGFVSFQFGELSEDSKPHQSILRLIQKHQIKGYPKGIHTLKDKDKEKDKDKDKRGSGGEDPRQKFGEFVLLSPREFEELKKKIGPKYQSYIERLDGYIGQIGVKKALAKYRSHYHTILNWHRKDIEDGKISETAKKVSQPSSYVEFVPPESELIGPEDIKKMREAIKKK